MNQNEQNRKKARSGRVNRFFTGGTFTVNIEMDDLDPATNDDEATLKSVDGIYSKTLKVSDVGIRVDDKFLRITFPGVIAGKQYDLEYDLKQDADGNELGVITVLYHITITSDDLDVSESVQFPSETPETWKGESFESTTYDAEVAKLYQEPEEAVEQKDDNNEFDEGSDPDDDDDYEDEMYYD